MLKFLHNDKVSLGWAILVEIAVHALFAFQAFLLGGFLGEIALTAIFGRAGAVIGAWALAIFVFGAAFQAFVYGEYMREHVESFETTAKGNGSYARSWMQVRWLVAGIELSSMLFRFLAVLQQGYWQSAFIILIFGAISLWYAFAQAKVIHASVNRPVEYEVARARETAGRAIVEDAMKYVPKMNAQDKKRFYTGDLDVIGEYEQSETDRKNEKLLPRKERRNRERQRQDHAKETMRLGGQFTSKLLGGDHDPVADYPFMQAQAKDIRQANGLGIRNGHNQN